MTANGIIFILSIIMMVFVTVVSFRKKDFRISEKKTLNLNNVCIGIVGVIAVLGFLDIFREEIFGLDGYYILLAIYLVGIVFIPKLIKKYQIEEQKLSFANFLMKTFAVVMVCELFVFNFNAYHIIFGDYKTKYIPVKEAKITTVQTKSTDTTYSFSDIGQEIGNLTIDAEIEGTSSEFMFQIDVSDESSEPLRNKAGKIWAVAGYEETFTAPMHFTGDVSKLNIKVYLPESQKLDLKGIELNAVIPVRFSFLRALLIAVSLIFVWCFLYGKNMNVNVEKNRNFFRFAVNFLTVICMYIMTFILCTSQYTDAGFSELFHMEKGDQMTQDLVDAFESGHTYMTFEPSEEILLMENPYDTNKRLELGYKMNVDYAWDHLLYEGKYYSYYGIAPVVLLFLPYHLITGYYFPAVIAVYIFSMLGLFSISRVYIQFIERWFKDIKSDTAIVGGIIMMASCGIWFSMARPLFYETAISAGFACVCSGAYFLITSNILQGDRISLKRLCISSVLLSLGVLSRPTTAVYCICACVFIIMGIKKAKAQYDGKIIKYILSAFLPFVIIGSIQMIYNYVRFSSPFDFGIQYSLTINDFTKSQYHSQFVFVTIFNFIFNAPAFVPEFPFVSTSFQALDTNGFYYKDASSINAISVGILYRAVPVFAYLLAGKAYKMSDSSDKKRNTVIVFVLSILAPLVILFSIWESGYAVRYTADFSWQILTGAYIILFTVIRKCQNIQVEKIINSAFLISMFLSLAVNFSQIYSFVLAKGMSDNYKASFYAIEKIFEFWR